MHFYKLLQVNLSILGYDINFIYNTDPMSSYEYILWKNKNQYHSACSQDIK